MAPASCRARRIASHASVAFGAWTDSAPGYRTHDIKIVTTLLDVSAHSAARIAAWYQRRWQVELYFDDIKTSLRTDTMRCKKPHNIARELLMHMIAYNLVRHLILSAEPLRATSFPSRDRWIGSTNGNGSFGARPTPSRHVAAAMTCCKPSPMIP